MKRLLALIAGVVLGACSSPACPPPAAAPVCPACQPCDCAASTSASPLSMAGGDSAGASPEAMVGATLGETADWAQFQRTPSRWGYSSAPALRRPTLRWHKTVGIQGYLNTPLISGPTVFVSSSGERHNRADPLDGIHALDRASGKTLWHAHLPADGNGIALVGSRLVATCDDGNVYGLDAHNGRIVWERRGQGKMYAHPTIIDDIVVVGDAGGNVRAYGWVSQGGEVAAFAKNGRLLWKKRVLRPDFGGSTRVPIEGYGAPIVSDSRLIVSFARDTTYDDPAFFALDAPTGAIRWHAKDRSQRTWGNIRSTPTLVNGLMIYGEPYSGDVAALDIFTGTVRYRKTIGGCTFPQYASPASAGDTVYLPRFDGFLYALEALTGRVQWRFYLGEATKAQVSPVVTVGATCSWAPKVGAPLYSPIAIAADGTIIVGNGEGSLFAIAES